MGGHPTCDLQDNVREQNRGPELRKPVWGEARGLSAELEGRVGLGPGLPEALRGFTGPCRAPREKPFHRRVG